MAGGVQYTIPVPEAVDAGAQRRAPAADHAREAPARLLRGAGPGADAEAVRQAIVTMPHYFDEYDTTVQFISAEQLAREHGAMPHGGFVIRSGNTSAANKQVIEYRLQLDSNPEFTSSVLVALRTRRAPHGPGRAVRLQTVFDVAPACCRRKARPSCVSGCCKPRQYQSKWLWRLYIKRH